MSVTTATERHYRVKCHRLENGDYELSYGRGRGRLTCVLAKHPDRGFHAAGFGRGTRSELKTRFFVWAKARYAGGIDAHSDDRSASAIAEPDDADRLANPGDEVPGDHPRCRCERCNSPITLQGWQRGLRLCVWCELPCDAQCCQAAGEPRPTDPCDCPCHCGERRRA